MNRSSRLFIKTVAMGIAVALILVFFCGYADEASALPEGEPAEAAAPEEVFTEDSGEPEAETAADEPGEDSLLLSEAAPQAPENGAALPGAEPTPTPTPMPMFDIIDGRTIYLSITEDEFVEIAEILRAGLGVNDAALAGIMGNLQGESGFNPHKVGDDGGAYGISQWRGPRLDQMVEYCDDHGLNPVSRDGQLSFLIYDLMNNYIYAYDQIRLCEDSERGALQATYNFCADYEVPANPEEESLEREEWTKLLIYPKLNELSEAS